MKKFTLFAVLFFSLVIYGGNEYHKFSGKNALWNSFTTGAMGYPREWQTIYTLGDTIKLDNQKYIEVKNSSNWNTYTLGGLREDTLTKKIYYNDYNDYYKEVILYDFSLNIGDTIFYGKQSGNPQSIYYKVVDSTGTINLNGELRKKWSLTTSLYNMKDIWIEGIGSVVRHGLLNPLKPHIPTDASSTYFGCFKYGNIFYFNRQATNSVDCPCSQWLVSVPELKSESAEIKLYPIPTKDKLNISLGNTTYDNLEIYTCNSKLIEKTKINSSETIELNLVNFENGIYFIKFSGKDNISLKKIVKL
jgi:hypothetical protein